MIVLLIYSVLFIIIICCFVICCFLLDKIEIPIKVSFLPISSLGSSFPNPYCLLREYSWVIFMPGCPKIVTPRGILGLIWGRIAKRQSTPNPLCDSNTCLLPSIFLEVGNSEVA